MASGRCPTVSFHVHVAPGRREGSRVQLGDVTFRGRVGRFGPRLVPLRRALRRLLLNLDVDLGDCSCCEGDPCPAHELVAALHGEPR
jgi:hypothetical protein